MRVGMVLASLFTVAILYRAMPTITCVVLFVFALDFIYCHARELKEKMNVRQVRHRWHVRQDHRA